MCKTKRKLKTENMPWSLPSTHCLCWVWPHMGSHIVFVLCKRDWSNANCRKVLSNKMFVITCRKTPRLPACLLRSGSTSQLEGPPPAMFKYCNKYFYVRMTAIVIFAIFASFNHYHVAWLTWEIIWVFGVDEKKRGIRNLFIQQYQDTSSTCLTPQTSKNIPMSKRRLD